MGWAALAFAIATLALAYPVFAGQFLVNPSSDQYIAGFAFRDFAAQSLRAGQGIPHWNPYMFGGLPYVAAMHGDVFYPTALLRLLMPTDLAMTWGFILHLFASGLFTYAFLRAWGLGFYPSLIGGMAYLLSGPIASYASPGHDGKLFVSALLPLALCAGALALTPAVPWLLPLALAIGITQGLTALWTATIGDRFEPAVFGSVMGAMGFCMLPLTMSGIQLPIVVFARSGRFEPAFAVFAGLTVVAARRRARLRVRDELFISDRGVVQPVSPAVHRHPRPVLGAERHPPA